MNRPSFPARLRRPLLWLLAALGAFIVLKFTLLAPMSVRAVAVGKRDLTAQVYGNGTVEAKVVVAVSSKVTGRIEELLADQGDKVKEGQLLAKLESEDFRQQVLQAQAQVNKGEASLAMERADLLKAQANLDLTRKSYERAKALGDQKMVSQQEVDEQSAALEVARKEVQRVEAVIEAARKDLLAQKANLAFAGSRKNDMLILAPQDGVIISRDLEKGATAAPGLPIFRLADPAVVWVKADVDESQRQALAVGQEASIYLRSAPNEKLPGRVARIGLESDRVTEEIEVDVLFDPPLANLRFGEQAEVFVVTGAKKNVPSLPVNVVTSKGKKRLVWVIEDGRLAAREIVVGMEDRAGFVEVLSGIGDKTEIAFAPPEKMMTFKDGMRVKVER
ncbi:MAG: efflux RND transporter periplasmic adaptor subunit [Myxococcales bacterium]|nr:MAG: efflux RND transporter periplasmic adaptor subunit [Myxococcales bacterium]